MKINKLKLLITSLVTLIPIPVGLALYSRLPDALPIHWGADGQADGFAHKAFAVLAMPLIMLALHFVTVFATSTDPKNRDQNPKLMGMTMYIAPIISLFVSAVTYAAAFGYEISGTVLPCVIIGIIFAVMGNYMPKCRPNSTVGLRVPWTLNSDENWKASHRFAGYVWFICGILCLASVFLPDTFRVIALIVAVFIAGIVPISYSYIYYHRQLKNGTYPTDKPLNSKHTTVFYIVIAILLAASLLTVIVTLFPGDISYEFTDGELILDHAYAPKYRIGYAFIDGVELRESDTPGKRTNGYGSSEMLTGHFRNDELDKYLRYTYTSCDFVIVIFNRPSNVVVNCKTEEETLALYEKLCGYLPDYKYN